MYFCILWVANYQRLRTTVLEYANKYVNERSFASEHILSNLSISCILRTGQIDDEDPSVLCFSQDGVLQTDGADGVAPARAVVLERRFGATMSKTLSNL